MSSKHLHGVNNRIGLATFADLICLLADASEPGRDNVPPLRPTPVQKLSIRELVLATQVILRQHFSVGLELFGADAVILPDTARDFV